MLEDELLKLLEDVKNSRVDVADALGKLKNLPYEDLGFAVLDHHRALRKGFPEVVFCQGKTMEQIAQIFQKLCCGSRSILGTRAVPEAYEAVREIYPDAEYNRLARTIVVRRGEEPHKKGNILVLSAGTADLPVAEEAAVTAEIMGNDVRKAYDVGVAGIHRLLDKLDLIRWAHVLIVVAGMEGALASVVGGLAEQPVIAVPTSVGYGASFNGLSALLCMLNSCASGVSVVNIDNGFGAGAMANAITLMMERAKDENRLF
ncbi:nickel pincer cofactor biosynthesis protein LarB [Desulfotomaculum copahuensis]|uniref:1-(5-phosphoribosyl)-5-amino-4-imidazole-carboxylate carboxylase n=1 Tax=Desulfotomaculum copahuensis TaxID=1838280 RepID=A0A1B7LIK0_9FIRM|nr:nickel pincer cofactor biosynthesis protein LarB [Desulfotomaculum copahuensis]OAT86383.1 1-(5-phosphoribosyl)-5-amino-4-imidazole-carboxylate carboxylase [Desulfotomaculum copahuensis]